MKATVSPGDEQADVLPVEVPSNASPSIVDRLTSRYEAHRAFNVRLGDVLFEFRLPVAQWEWQAVQNMAASKAAAIAKSPLPNWKPFLPETEGQRREVLQEVFLIGEVLKGAYTLEASEGADGEPALKRIPEPALQDFDLVKLAHGAGAAIGEISTRISNAVQLSIGETETAGIEEAKND
jgi:hypothetical protein